MGFGMSGVTKEEQECKMYMNNHQLSPQLISSEWSLQSTRPSQSTETETHSSLCWQANWPGLQRCTVTFPPSEGAVVILLGVTSSSTAEEKLFHFNTDGKLVLQPTKFWSETRVRPQGFNSSPPLQPRISTRR